ncbi:hypothetical protein J6590_044770 [Homalodisca vitripennis]|nr:hypothetical protein J6590_044770 [Homalodisca vitripennis]
MWVGGVHRVTDNVVGATHNGASIWFRESRSGYESSESDDLSDESGAADDAAKARSRQVVHKGRWTKEEVSVALVCARLYSCMIIL